MAEKNTGEPVVSGSTNSTFSDLWKHEDYWSIWLGLILLIGGIAVFFPRGPENFHGIIKTSNTALESESASAPFKTIAWYQAIDNKNKLKATGSDIAKAIKKFTHKPHKWSVNPLETFYLGKESAEEEKSAKTTHYNTLANIESGKLQAAVNAEEAAREAGFSDNNLNDAAVKAIEAWRTARIAASAAKSKTKIEPYNQIPYLIGLMIVLGLFFGIGITVMGHSFSKFFKGFLYVFLIAAISYVAAENATMSHYGIGYAAWAILIGLIISNTVGLPKWVEPALQTEFYIKTGLVLLGAEVLFGKIMSIGIPGIFVAWLVTPVVLAAGYIFGDRVLKIKSKTLNVTISAAYSVCGVSAAIATAAACKAKKEELTLAVGLSLIFTSLMMILMPPFIKIMGMGEVLGGAWMGGTIDATGAVAAAGAFLGERALYVSATIKMIQNVLIGVIAFFVALYWCTKIDCEPGQRVGLIEIWHRFPKFVIGFIGASIIFSVLYESLGRDVSYVLIDNGAIRGFSKIFRGWFFCLAFVSIGLATNFRELKSHFTGGKPFLLYIFGQTFNLILTLLIAFLAFYVVFPHITAGI